MSFAHYSSCQLESSKPHPCMFYCSRLFFLPLTELCVVILYQQPAWNNALLKMFRCNFEGTDPYITCIPFLHHHRLSPQDQFLVLSSDGLYQYLSNEEVVCHVEWFMQNFPDGDPAQHLIEELLFRAAKKNGRTSALFTILSTRECGIWWFSAAARPWYLSWATILISRRLILSGNTQHWVTSILTLVCVYICIQFSNKSGHDIITLVLGFSL